MLYSQRRREQQYAEREAAGESLWTTEISEPARRRVLFTYEDALRDKGYYLALMEDTQGLLLRVYGRPDLGIPGSPVFDVEQFMVSTSDDYALDVLEAMIALLPQHSTERSRFIADVNQIFRQERLAYEVVNGQVVPFSSRELHTEVVVPTITLLGGRTELAMVETAYQNALEELGRGDAGDAITDAGTALQEMLTALKCTGNALGQMIDSAFKKGLIGGHDRKLLDWVAAERNTQGDAHKVTDADLNDAWLMVHVVGALILHLSNSNDVS